MKQKTVKYTLTLSKDSEDAAKKVCYFFDIDFTTFIMKAMKFMSTYMCFIKKNPNGKLIFESENTRQEILIFNTVDLIAIYIPFILNKRKVGIF